MDVVNVTSLEQSGVQIQIVTPSVNTVMTLEIYVNIKEEWHHERDSSCHTIVDDGTCDLVFCWDMFSATGLWIAVLSWMCCGGSACSESIDNSGYCGLWLG